jgi:hypothetical protein
VKSLIEGIVASLIASIVFLALGYLLHQPTLIKVIAAIIFFLVVLAYLGWRLTKEMRRLQKIWQLGADDKVAFFLSNAGEMAQPEYIKQVVSVGQVQAFADIVSSLKKAYPKLDLPEVNVAIDRRKDNFSREVLEATGICLGGPVRNWVSDEHLQEIASRVWFENHVLVYRKTKSGRENRRQAGHKDNAIVADYGIIVKLRNRYNKNKRAFILAGCHSFGTVAAARFFCEKLPEEKEIISRDQFCVVVRGEVKGLHVLSPDLIDHFALGEEEKA